MANGWLGRDGARLVAAGRVAVGVGTIARPDLFPAMLGIDSGTADRMAWLGRMFGAREIALGVGLLRAKSPAAERDWLLGAALCDAVDSVAFAGAIRRGYVRTFVAAPFVAVAALAAGAEVVAWRAGRD